MTQVIVPESLSPRPFVSGPYLPCQTVTVVRLPNLALRDRKTPLLATILEPSSVLTSVFESVLDTSLAGIFTSNACGRPLGFVAV